MLPGGVAANEELAYLIFSVFDKKEDVAAAHNEAIWNRISVVHKITIKAIFLCLFVWDYIEYLKMTSISAAGAWHFCVIIYVSWRLERRKNGLPTGFWKT